MGDLSANFSASEFECQCGCGGDSISSSLVNMLQVMRDNYGRGIVITSGIRCGAHNEKIGGVASSAHVPADIDDGEGEVGHAVDIATLTSIERHRLLPLAYQVGFERVGIGENFIHLDIDIRKSQEVSFDYYKGDHQA